MFPRRFKIPCEVDCTILLEFPCLLRLFPISISLIVCITMVLLLLSYSPPVWRRAYAPRSAAALRCCSLRCCGRRCGDLCYCGSCAPPLLSAAAPSAAAGATAVTCATAAPAVALAAAALRLLLLRLLLLRLLLLRLLLLRLLLLRPLPLELPASLLTSGGRLSLSSSATAAPSLCEHCI